VALPERNPTQTDSAEKRSVGRGIFKKCAGCGHVLTAPEFAARLHVCPSCGHHHRMSASEWRAYLLDEGSFEVWDDHIVPADPLLFVDDKPYPERVARAQKQTGVTEARMTRMPLTLASSTIDMKFSAITPSVAGPVRPARSLLPA